MTKFEKTFLGKPIHEVAEFLSAEYHAAAEILHPLFEAIIADMAKHGVTIVKDAAAAALASAIAARTSGKTPSEAGKNALAAAETAAVAGLVVLGKTILEDGQAALQTDTAHALATAAVAGTQGQ